VEFPRGNSGVARALLKIDVGQPDFRGRIVKLKADEKSSG
jgi:hypothetical protein